MSIKKMHTIGFATGWEPTSERRSEPRARPLTNNYPRLLGGKELKVQPLPRDFDVSAHRRAKTLGVEATSLSELEEMIAALEGKAPQVGEV